MSDHFLHNPRGSKSRGARAGPRCGRRDARIPQRYTLHEDTMITFVGGGVNEIRTVPWKDKNEND